MVDGYVVCSGSVGHLESEVSLPKAVLDLFKHDVSCIG